MWNKYYRLKGKGFRVWRYWERTDIHSLNQHVSLLRSLSIHAIQQWPMTFARRACIVWKTLKLINLGSYYFSHQDSCLNCESIGRMCQQESCCFSWWCPVYHSWKKRLLLFLLSYQFYEIPRMHEWQRTVTSDWWHNNTEYMVRLGVVDILKEDSKRSKHNDYR